MYTATMYEEDRTWILDKIRSLRYKRNGLVDDHGFDVLFPDDISEINRSIRAYQVILSDSRKRYYSQWEH